MAEGPEKPIRVVKDARPSPAETIRRTIFGRGRILKILLVIAVLIVLFFQSLFDYVAPNEWGIKVVKIGAGRGVQKHAYTAGWYFVPSGLQQMHHLPRDIQVLELSNYKATASSAATIERAAHIQTSDGFFVDVDVSILYHIEDPYLVFSTIGPGDLYISNGIIPKTEPALKENLGELTTEEFYNSFLRVEKTQAALDLLNTELNPKGIVVDHVLIRYFHYSEEIQQNIEAKKLEDQKVFMNLAVERAKKAEAQLKRVREEGVKSVDIEISKGEAYVQEMEGEIAKLKRKRTAEADLLVKLARAESSRLLNAALEGKGSDLLVGMEMAEALSGLDVIVLSSDGANGVNPLDLDAMLKLFGSGQNDIMGGF